MGTIIKNQKGFSAIEALLILVIAGMLGFTGWYVWHAKQTADKTLSSNNSSTPTFKKKSTDSTASQPTVDYTGWKTYTKFGISFKYPANWYAQFDGSIVTVSSVKNPLPGQRGNQDKRPQYNKNLFLSLYDLTGAAATQYTDVTKSNYEVLQHNFMINGSAYCVIGNHNYATNGNPITAIQVAACKGNMALGGIPFKDGHVISNYISSVGNGGAATVAISQENPEYTTLESVLASIKF